MRDIAVQRAQAFYQPPPSQASTAWDLVPAAERVWRWYEHANQRRVQPPAGFIVGVSVYARINHGRWIADCTCGSAQVVTPDDPRFACPECGYGWVRVTFPANPAQAEDAVADLPPHRRNWWHDDDLTARDRPGRPDRPAPPVDNPRPDLPAVPQKGAS
ncbi:hypothetical protein [Streptomyces sp. NPDC012888]|uniref:hypothetical protein n=1 Tax=Streptomyces sp. NPDC012888 TaxID=3364855 RepID=UPI0036C7B2AA